MEQWMEDYHCHSLHSMDGRQSVEELCRAMIAAGISECCLTEHIEPGHPDPDTDVPPIWDVWFREIAQARQQFPQLTIRAGVEIGDNPVCRKETMALLDSLPLDYRLLSLHLVDGVDPYDHRYFEGKTRAEAYRAYAKAKADSVCAWADFDSVAHIGYVAKFSVYQGEEKPLRYEDAPEEFDRLLTSVIQRDRCIEINTSGYDATGDTLPHTSILQRYIALGGTCFTFGSDGHDPSRDGKDIRRAMEQVRGLGGKYQATFCKRKRTLRSI